LLRVAGRKTGESRWVRAIYKGASVTLKSSTRVLHILWLEVTGLFFVALAFVGAAAAIREHHRQLSGSGSAAKMLLASGFAVLFTYFGVSSFWRSKRR
jgi:threonine/homoserine/homoserine lactone efflux protein